jgi:uncharacterized phage protein gp47/JayE
MADLLDFVPVRVETTDTIRARIDADVNAGVDPSSPAFIDTTEGGIYFDVTQPVVLELARVWDFAATEVPATQFPEFAWGTYLDEWGVTLKLPRKDAVVARGDVTFTGTVGSLIATGTQVATPQTDPDVAPPVFETTASGVIPIGGSITLAVAAIVPGTIGNVATGTITLLLSPVQGIAAVTNPAALSGGAEVETDEAYRTRLLLELSAPAGGGNQADYLKWALAYPGVGHASVQPLWAGPGTVRVVITDTDNNPSAGAVVTGLQAQLDPVAQQGAGLAPIGAAVTVATPTPVTVNISATIVFLAGYSLDGAAGTIATRQAIIDALAEYVGNLVPGDDVIYNHVESQFFRVRGIYNVASVLLNGAAADVAIAGLQIADLGVVTLI